MTKRQKKQRELPLIDPEDCYGLHRCPECGFVGSLDEFDYCGLGDAEPIGTLFCNGCDAEVEPEEVT